jgi:hypothetical protein
VFFLSYARADEPVVRALVEDLRQLGDVWRDQEIAGGQAWWREILRQVRACHLCVFALSEASLASPACRAELDYAWATHRPILPVQVGDVAYLPRRIGELQIVDYRVGTSAGGVRLATAVHRFDGCRPPLPSPLPWDPEVPERPPTASHPHPDPQPRPPTSTPSRSRRGPALAVAGVLAAALVAGGAAYAQAGSAAPPSSGSSDTGPGSDTGAGPAASTTRRTTTTTTTTTTHGSRTNQPSGDTDTGQ